MKKLLIVLMAFSLSFIVIPATADDFESIVLKEAIDSVMLVRGPTGGGSGVVISDKIMITAYHVVENRSTIDELSLIQIIDRHGNLYKAEVFASDKKNDLALLRLLEGSFDVRPAKIAKQTLYRLGDPIFSVGYNLQGIERYKHELLPEDNYTENPVPRIGFGNISDIRPSLVYIDIGTYSWGSSGGGTFTKSGKLIGINSMIITDGGSKFGAIRPIDAVGFKFDVEIPKIPKKKINEYNVQDKYRSLFNNIYYGSGPPASHGRFGQPIYRKQYLFSSGMIIQDKYNYDTWKRWVDAGMPTQHWIAAYAGSDEGFAIEEYLIWEYSDGYERRSFVYIIDLDYDVIKTAEGKFSLNFKGLKPRVMYSLYIVANSNGRILNMHDDYYHIYYTDKLQSHVPKLENWFNLMWNEWVAPFYKGE